MADDAPAACRDALSTYRVTVVPEEPGTTGRRFFSTDATGVVMQADNAAFTGARPVQ